MTTRRFKIDIRQIGRPIGIGLALLAVANAAFFLLATRPSIREYGALRVGTAPQQQAIREQRKQVELLESFLESVHDAESDLERLRREVLSTRQERMIDIHVEVERLAGKFGIDFESITFDNEILVEEELDRHVMNVPLEGGYANLRKFLQAVESSEKFLVVERVALGEGKEGGVMLELTITLATYFDSPEQREENKRNRRRRPARTRSG